MRGADDLPSLHGEGRRAEGEPGWGGIAAGGLFGPHPADAAHRLSLPTRGRETGVAIAGYASLWGVADLNGDVVARRAFADSLARTGAAGVRMLHGHDERAVVGVWDEVREDETGLFVRGRIMDWSAQARFAAALARAGALNGLSIGFRTARARREGRLRVLSGVDLWEVSLVTFPALVGARFVIRDPERLTDAPSVLLQSETENAV